MRVGFEGPPLSYFTRVGRRVLIMLRAFLKSISKPFGFQSSSLELEACYILAISRRCLRIVGEGCKGCRRQCRPPRRWRTSPVAITSPTNPSGIYCQRRSQNGYGHICGEMNSEDGLEDARPHVLPSGMSMGQGPVGATVPHTGKFHALIQHAEENLQLSGSEWGPRMRGQKA